MGLHTLHPQPEQGLGPKVQRMLDGIGTLKTAHEIGELAAHAIHVAAPYVRTAATAAMTAGRAAVPFARNMRVDGPRGRSARTLRADRLGGLSARTVRADGPRGRSALTVWADDQRE